MDAAARLDHSRLAIAVLAARERGDLREATELLEAFPDAGAMAAGFLSVGELVLHVGAGRAGVLPAELLQEVGYGLASAETVHREDPGGR